MQQTGSTGIGDMAYRQTRPCQTRPGVELLSDQAELDWFANAPIRREAAIARRQINQVGQPTSSSPDPSAAH